ncbi:MAG: hypothetical protein M3Q30_22745 [Actinomycetota bacterium]|nr:hypothetical protein [Actinomycetota bacterium]
MARCLFCNHEGQVTQEHAPPKWTKKAFFARNPDRDPNGIRKVRGDSDRPSPHFSDWTDALCASCRVWWNKNFEDRARQYIEPILFGEAVTVPETEVPVVATWIGYQSMIRAKFFQDPTFGEYPSENFRYIRLHRQLPDDHVLWVACRGDDVTSVTPDPTVTPWSYEPECPVSRSVLFKLVYRHHYCAPNATTARHDGEGNHAVVRLWPWPGGNLDWPPPSVLTVETYSKLYKNTE